MGNKESCKNYRNKRKEEGFKQVIVWLSHDEIMAITGRANTDTPAQGIKKWAKALMAITDKRPSN